MKFHVYYNEFGEPLAHIEIDAIDTATVSAALTVAVRERIKWIGEQKDKKYQDDRMRVFSELAALSGAFDLVQQTLWPLHEAFVEGLECDCGCEEEESDGAHA